MLVGTIRGAAIALNLGGMGTRTYLGRAASTVSFVAAFAVAANAEPIGWPQPNGPGSPVYLTYSFSNLLSPGFNSTLSATELREATARAFLMWATYAPIVLTEIAPGGPPPSETDYSPEGLADIRIGYLSALADDAVGHVHVLDGGHDASGGLAGDIHLTNDLSQSDLETWGHDGNAGPEMDFFSVMLHETGHALGLLHLAGPAIMSTGLHIFPDPADADLFPADIAAIQGMYGAGHGSVRPLPDAAEPMPEPASILLSAAGVGALVARRRRLHKTSTMVTAGSDG